MSAKITIIQYDITQLAVDVIVNAANPTLLGGGGVDGAIHRAAGPELLAACKKLNGCETGQAKITPGFQLPAKAVIHTVGPIWRGGDSNEVKLLADCYVNSLALAQQYNHRSIAFPAISCGAYGFPIVQACHIAVSKVSEQISRNPDLRKVIFCAFDDIIYQQLILALNDTQMH